MSRFSDYADAAAKGFTRLLWRHELISPVGLLLATTDAAAAKRGGAIKWGATLSELTSESGRLSYRTASLSAPVDHADLLPGCRCGIMHPDSESRVRVSAGIRTADGTTKWWTQATLVIRDVEVVATGGGASRIDAELVDLAGPLDSRIPTAFAMTAGEPVEDVVDRLIGQVLGPVDYSIQPTGQTTPRVDIPAGEDRLPIVVDLIEGCGFELVAEPEGPLAIRAIPQADNDGRSDRWKYGTGGHPIDSIARLWNRHRPRGWTGTGSAPDEDSPELEVTVYDLDPDSEGYWPGVDVAVDIDSTEFPYARSVAQLREASYAQLRRNGPGPGIVEFEALPNPAMRVGDLVDIVHPGADVDGPYRVLRVGLPLQVEGRMTVRARAAWVPDLGFSPPGLDLDPTCLNDSELPWTDDFERADQNLEIKPPQAGGSAEWTEHGFSWWVRGGDAVQQFKGWSLAMLTKPVCPFDHYAEIVLGKLPAGKRIGPAIRGDGEFTGYAALVYPGQVTLELWKGGQRAAPVLGSWQYSGSLVGSTIRVEAEGTTIRAVVNGTTRIEVTDDRLTGRHVGMLGYGAFGNQAPRARRFATGATS